MGFIPFIVSFSVSLFLLKIIIKNIYKKNEESEQFVIRKPFVVSEYYDRMEKVMLDILEEQESKKPYLITLWWGLDGLQINEDDTIKWIRRRRQEPVNNKYYNTFCYNNFGAYSVIHPQQEAINWLMKQNNIQRTRNIQSQFTLCQIPPPAYLQYPMAGYLDQINGCCCDSLCNKWW